MRERSDNPLNLGGHFVLDGEAYETDSYLSLSKIMAVRLQDGEKIAIDVHRIVESAMVRANLQSQTDIEATGIEAMSEGDLKVASDRRDKLTLLIEATAPTRELAKSIAQELGVSVATIYRWRLAYKESGALKALAPHHPTGGRGDARIDPDVEAVVQDVIRDMYLTKQKLTVSKVETQVERQCRRAKLKTPHASTIRRRIAALTEREKNEARDGVKGKKKYEPVPGRFPGADYPNAVWQIDHTPADICIVDDVYRRNIGRCWLTVAIDVFSRCVVGFYLSLDAPNATSVGMCLTNAILMKDGWLKAHGLQVPWNVWGKPRTVHADNDKTFRCDTVSQAAKLHRINLEWRPVKKPRWGGHIERLLGTLNREIHTLPGTTFANPLVRGDYKPHEEAELTFGEFERYFAQYICGVYHADLHEGIRRSPISKYEAGLLGDGNVPGIGFPEHEKDPARLVLDFLPMKKATVQSNGITVNSITYYDPLLDPWIHAMDSGTKKKRKFICRQDPRDISVLWFLDPDKDRYFKVGYRNPEYPSITLWEYRALRLQLKAEGHKTVDEDLIFDTYDRLERLRKDASQATQAARKAEQKKKVHDEKKRVELAQVTAAAREVGQDVPALETSPDPKRSAAALNWEDDEDVPRYRETN